MTRFEKLSKEVAKRKRNAKVYKLLSILERHGDNVPVQKSLFMEIIGRGNWRRRWERYTTSKAEAREWEAAANALYKCLVKALDVPIEIQHNLDSYL